MHEEDVLVDSDASFSVDAGDLELVDCYFVVPGLEGNADLKQFFFDVCQSFLQVTRQLGIVVFSKLLISSGVSAHQGTAQPFQIFPLFVVFRRNYKKFLLQSYKKFSRSCFNSNLLQERDRCLLQSLLAHTEEGLHVESFSIMADQKRWNVESSVASADIEV